MNYETRTKQGHKIIARGYSGNHMIVLVERNYGKRKDYVIAIEYSEMNGEWEQERNLTRFRDALQTFMNYTWHIQEINYKEE